jgi:hypothetical protein
MSPSTGGVLIVGSINPAGSGPRPSPYGQAV